MAAVHPTSFRIVECPSFSTTLFWGALQTCMMATLDISWPSRTAQAAGSEQQLQNSRGSTLCVEAVALHSGGASSSLGIPHAQAGIVFSPACDQRLAVWREGPAAHRAVVAREHLHCNSMLNNQCLPSSAGDGIAVQVQQLCSNSKSKHIQ